LKDPQKFCLNSFGKALEKIIYSHGLIPINNKIVPCFLLFLDRIHPHDLSYGVWLIGESIAENSSIEFVIPLEFQD